MLHPAINFLDIFIPYFHGVSCAQYFSYPASRLDFLPHPASRQAYVGPYVIYSSSDRKRLLEQHVALVTWGTLQRSFKFLYENIQNLMCLSMFSCDTLTL